MNKVRKRAPRSRADTVFGREYNETDPPGRDRLPGQRPPRTRPEGPAEVKHSTKKPWRQEGTDRAGAGG